MITGAPAWCGSHRRVILCAAFLLACACPVCRAQLAGQPGGVAAQPASQTCAGECHKDILGHKVMHGPVQRDCAVCHIAIGAAKDHKFSLILPKEQLCIKCHVLPHQAGMHAPVQEGRCMDCHDPHGSQYVRALVADPKRDLCARCHKQDFSKFKFTHGPVAVGACIVCHKPHSSDQPKLLAQDPKSLCLSCHGEVQTKGEEGVHVHAALEQEQGCVRCHDPHASDHKFQLRDAAPGLCLQCHKEHFDQITAGNKFVHGAITAEGGCTTCHEPHASKLPALQRGTQPDTCLACHNVKLKASDGSTLTNMAALLAANPDRHGPIREGACTACHSPHAGNNFRMLTEEYPPQFYAPFKMETFRLCFKCHIPDLVLKPSGQGLTQFRNGDRNLHWVHVNQEKGRTCRACHEVHASTRPAHIREAVPFGSSGWMLEINYEKSEEGGRCSPGCHSTRSYNRSALTPLPAPARPGAKQ